MVPPGIKMYSAFPSRGLRKFLSTFFSLFFPRWAPGLARGRVSVLPSSARFFVNGFIAKWYHPLHEFFLGWTSSGITHPRVIRHFHLHCFGYGVELWHLHNMKIMRNKLKPFALNDILGKTKRSIYIAAKIREHGLGFSSLPQSRRF